MDAGGIYWATGATNWAWEPTAKLHGHSTTGLRQTGRPLGANRINQPALPKGISTSGPGNRVEQVTGRPALELVWLPGHQSQKAVQHDPGRLHLHLGVHVQDVSRLGCSKGPLGRQLLESGVQAVAQLEKQAEPTPLADSIHDGVHLAPRRPVDRPTKGVSGRLEEGRIHGPWASPGQQFQELGGISRAQAVLRAGLWNRNRIGALIRTEPQGLPPSGMSAGAGDAFRSEESESEMEDGCCHGASRTSNPRPCNRATRQVEDGCQRGIQRHEKFREAASRCQGKCRLKQVHQGRPRVRLNASRRFPQQPRQQGRQLAVDAFPGPGIRCTCGNLLKGWPVSSVVRGHPGVAITHGRQRGTRQCPAPLPSAAAGKCPRDLAPLGPGISRGGFAEAGVVPAPVSQRPQDQGSERPRAPTAASGS